MTHYLVPILTLKDNGGGAVAMAFARQLRATGARVTVISSGFHGTQALQRPENAGIDFVIAPAGIGGRVGALLTFFAWAIACSLTRRPRLVYTHIATSLIPDLSGVKPLMLAQDLEYRFYSPRGRRIAKLLFARVTRRASLVVSSWWLERFFRRIHADILFAGDVGISKAFFGGSALGDAGERGDDFLLIAKPGHHKRHDETCEVARRLALGGHQVTLIDQARDASLPAGSASLRVVDAVTQFEMRECFRRARVFIGLSRAEGYGLTPLEALAQGCRVVTTPTPSTARVRSDALAVVAGSDDLLGRVVDAALAQRREADAAAIQSTRAYDGPFMEDWAAAAVAALRGTMAP
jgi:hypothetical protein